MRRKGGFTVVELLIVIVVIAILATISLVAYQGLSNRAYTNRVVSELSSLARATEVYSTLYKHYPADVDRGVPAGITELINGSDTNWPDAPWPNSVYDYDYWVEDVGGVPTETVQISIRFCAQGETDLSNCSFPNEPWAEGFQTNSSYYWCIEGACRAHRTEPADYPGECANCKE